MEKKDMLSMVVSKADFEAAMETMIVASTAVSTGTEVRLFFTFWGLKLLVEGYKPKLSGIMRPFTFMMRRKMKKMGVPSFEELRQLCLDAGVTLYACGTSMDLMGISDDDLIDGVETAGAATFIGDASQSSVQLFVG